MSKHPLTILRENDPALFDAVGTADGLAFQDGAIPTKYKLLTALALDAAAGSATGVKALAMRAMAAGATKEEIFEILRVAWLIGGAGSAYTAAYGLNELFNQASPV